MALDVADVHAEVYALMGDAEAAVEPLKELAKNRYYELGRILTERTFDPVRSSDVFIQFVSSIPSELLTLGAEGN